MIKIPSKYLSNLDLSNKGLTKFPMEVFELKNLKILNLSGNRIVTVPQDIIKLKHLKSLDLSNNEINNFFSKICDLPNLKVLNLNNNKIKTIPNQICKLAKLEKLFIANNSLQKIPSTFTELKELRELNISKNKFRDFPEEFLKLQKLKSIWLNNLELENFPLLEITSLPNLKNLYCFGLLQNDNKLDPFFYNLSAIRGNSLATAITLAATFSQNLQITGNNMKTKKNNIL